MPLLSEYSLYRACSTTCGWWTRARKTRINRLQTLTLFVATNQGVFDDMWMVGEEQEAEESTSSDEEEQGATAEARTSTAVTAERGQDKQAETQAAGETESCVLCCAMFASVCVCVWLKRELRAALEQTRCSHFCACMQTNKSQVQTLWTASWHPPRKC